MNDPQPVQAGAELLPCPFCGGNASTCKTDVRPCELEGWTDAWWAGCVDSVRCSGRLPKLHKTEAEAAAAWNSRATYAGGSSELVERHPDNPDCKRCKNARVVTDPQPYPEKMPCPECCSRGWFETYWRQERDKSANLTDELTRLREKVGKAEALLNRAGEFVRQAPKFDWNEDRCIMSAVHLAEDIRQALADQPK